ncbi:hypothetical protein JNB63_00245 [Microbacterium trichothecenolyticum]|uniref:hypothetical protein n=1 Tax=Microbacterium trichothecenolyticum TaxID=69370 RepID=UPI001C6EF70E|nr:hypothetical protein [Microbacterium trichothecenolyticum]MBW9118522.1 hypothetical protein [Microbacterium trichothecenolyticum]
MGLFSKLPEEPAEWAGLPSEPARAETQAERLTDAAAVDPGGLGLGDLSVGGGGRVESIVIPVAPIVEVTRSQDSGEDR